MHTEILFLLISAGGRVLLIVFEKFQKSNAHVYLYTTKYFINTYFGQNTAKTLQLLPPFIKS